MNLPRSVAVGGRSEEPYTSDISLLRAILTNIQERIRKHLVSPVYGFFWTLPRVRAEIRAYVKIGDDLDIVQEVLSADLKDMGFCLEWLCSAREEKFICQLCPCPECEISRNLYDAQKRLSLITREQARSAENMLEILNAHLNTMQVSPNAIRIERGNCNTAFPGTET